MEKIYIGKFKWEKGSINDNIRKILIGLNIGYYNTFNGDIYTDTNEAVEAEYCGNNEYFVYILVAE